jgi:acyl-coenzyme A synthetase/AMP-(fatty) acid ligase
LAIPLLVCSIGFCSMFSNDTDIDRSTMSWVYSSRAAIITNSITGVVIALAAASIGAIFSSTATDMGTSGILDRYRQIRPKILFASSETVYAGKTINITQKIADVVSDLRASGYGLETAVILRSDRTGNLVQVPNWLVPYLRMS